MERATLCLINAERTSRGLHALTNDGRFRRIALDHSRDMVAHHYFAHLGPGGQDFMALTVKLYRGRVPYLVGENLGWGEGAKGTPRFMVRLWMASAEHRRNVLTHSFARIGIGIVPAVPRDRGHPGATYTTEFGTR